MLNAVWSLVWQSDSYYAPAELLAAGRQLPVDLTRHSIDTKNTPCLSVSCDALSSLHVPFLACLGKIGRFRAHIKRGVRI
jgi:hypothetical protein